MNRIKVILVTTAGILMLAAGGCSEETPQTGGLEIPRWSHFDDARLKKESSIELHAGDTGSLRVTLETRSDGPGRFSCRLYHVAGKYGDEREEEIPMPDRLKAYLKPSEFTAWPHRTYRPSIIIETAPDLAPGEYLLLFEHKMENAFNGSGIITVTVKEPENP